MLWFQSEQEQDNGYEIKAQVIYLKLKKKNKYRTLCPFSLPRKLKKIFYSWLYVASQRAQRSIIMLNLGKLSSVKTSCHAF